MKQMAPNTFILSLFGILAVALPTSISFMQGSVFLLFFVFALRLPMDSNLRKGMLHPMFLIALLVLVLAPVPSMLDTLDLHMSLRWYKRHAYVLAIPVIAGSVLYLDRRARYLLPLYVAVSAVAAAYAILQVFFGLDLSRDFKLDTYYVHARAFFSMSNTLAEVLTFSLIGTILFTSRSHRRWSRYMGIICVLLVFAAILLTRTRTASVVAAVSGVCLIVYVFRKRSLPALLAVLLAVLIIHATNDRVFWRFSSFESDRGHRFLLWDYAIHAFRENPLTGCGIGTFDFYLKHHAEEDDQHLSRYDHAHNNILDTAATTGLIGLIAFFLFWGRVVWDMWRKFRTETDREWKHLWLAMLLSVVAFHLEGMTECTLKDTEVAIQLYSVTGLFYGLVWFHLPSRRQTSQESKSVSVAS